jgi:hypothetical protein
VFENRVLRIIFGLKREEVIGGWRKLHNEELHNLHSSANIIRMIKLWNSKVLHKGLPTVSQYNPVHISINCLLRKHFNIVFPLLSLPSKSLVTKSSTKILSEFLTTHPKPSECL